MCSGSAAVFGHVQKCSSVELGFSFEFLVKTGDFSNNKEELLLEL